MTLIHSPHWPIAVWLLVSLVSGLAGWLVLYDLRGATQAQIGRVALAVPVVLVLAGLNIGAVIVNPCADIQPYSVLWWVMGCWLLD